MNAVFLPDAQQFHEFRRQSGSGLDYQIAGYVHGTLSECYWVHSGLLWINSQLDEDVGMEVLAPRQRLDVTTRHPSSVLSFLQILYSGECNFSPLVNFNLLSDVLDICEFLKLEDMKFNIILHMLAVEAAEFFQNIEFQYITGDDDANEE